MLGVDAELKIWTFARANISSKAALSIRAISIVASVIAIYSQDLVVVANDALNSDLMSYVLAIPVLFIYLIYRRRKILRATLSVEKGHTNQELTPSREIVGFLFCLTAFLLYWGGSYTFYPLEYHMVSLPVFTAGLILIMFNVKTLKVLAFPIVFLLFLTPPPTEIISIAGANVATFSSDVSYSILKAIGLPVSQISEYGAPALVVTDASGSQVSFVVGIASSGIYSIIGFSVFAIFIMYIARGPAWKKATVLFASLPIIYLLTILRIMTLVSLGHWQGVNVAWDTFHLLGASVLIFLGSIILLSISEKILKLRLFTTKSITTTCTGCSSSMRTKNDLCLTCGRILRYPQASLSKRDIGKITMLIIATSLILTLTVPVFALSVHPPQVLVKTLGNEQTTATQLFPDIRDYNLTFVYRDTEFERIASRDRALVYAYTPPDSDYETVFVAVEIGASRSVWHSWESSVITWPQSRGRSPQGIQIDLRDIQLIDNPPLIGRYFAFMQTQTNVTQVVLYWMGSAYFDTGSSTELKYVKISLVIFPKNSGNILETEDLLLPFAKEILDFWQPIKTWSQISLMIAQNGALLTAIPVILLALILTTNLVQNYGNKKANLRIYNQLETEKEKHILQAVQGASKKGKSTTNAVALEYQRHTGETIESKELLRTLEQAEKLGLVRKGVMSIEDQPFMMWKNQIQLQKNLLKKFASKVNKIFGVITYPMKTLRRKASP